VNITNNSATNLVIDGIFLSGGYGAGQITLTGGATASSAPGLTLSSYASGLTTPLVDVQLTNSTPVGSTTVNAGASLFLTGPINNTLGDVSLAVIEGSFIQEAPVNATSILINVPLGVSLVDTDSYWGIAGDIQSAWQNLASASASFTTGTEANGTTVPSIELPTSYFLPGLITTGDFYANHLVATAANYLFNPDQEIQSAYGFTTSVIGQTTNTANGTGTSYVFFGDAMP